MAGVGKSRFVIDADEVKSTVEKSGGTVLDLLQSLSKSAKSLARPPISNYRVGAAGLASDGRIFLGVNLEFPGMPLHQSVHAEQFLVSNAALHGARRIDCIAVSSVPCGHCRQFLQEIRGAPDIQISTADSDGKYSAYGPLLDLLPRRFGPDDLLDEDAPLLLEPHDNGVGWWAARPRNGWNGASEELRRAAAKAANEAHAPYTGCPSGVALADAQGRVYAGGYAESAAYNPGLGAVQAAVVAYVAGGGGEYGEIVAAGLVEMEGAAVAQEGTARLLVQAITPSCEFYCFRYPASPKEQTPAIDSLIAY